MARILRRTADVTLALLAVACFVAGIAVQVVPLTGRELVVIAGGSMEPALPIGSLAVVRAMPESALAPGDVVSIRAAADRAVVTHRIVRIVDRDGGSWLELQGDANDEPDPVLIPAATVVGRVESVHPNAGRFLRAFATPSGVLVAAGVAGLLFGLSLSLRHERRSEPEIPVPVRAAA
jgi:signal peptidase